jgi:hypothetical protein
MQKMTATKARKKDTREKIELGGLIAKEGPAASSSLSDIVSIAMIRPRRRSDRASRRMKQSGSSFSTEALADGETDVFINIDLKTLETPGWRVSLSAPSSTRSTTATARSREGRCSLR